MYLRKVTILFKAMDILNCKGGAKPLNSYIPMHICTCMRYVGLRSRMKGKRNGFGEKGCRGNKARGMGSISRVHCDLPCTTMYLKTKVTTIT